MKKLLFIILSTFVFTSCVTIQQRNASLGWDELDNEEGEFDFYELDEIGYDESTHSWYIMLQKRMWIKAKEEAAKEAEKAEKERRANLTPEQRRLEDKQRAEEERIAAEQRAEKERLAAEARAAQELQRLKWIEYEKSYPPQISFNGGVLSGEFSIDELRNLTKVIISKNKKSTENYQFQISSCEVSWATEDGTQVIMLKRGDFKPIQAKLANAKPGQTFIFSKIKVNVFENKKFLVRKDYGRYLYITVK